MSPTPTSARLQALRVADAVIAAHAGEIGTHSAGCYRHHAGCLAVLIRDILEKDPT